MHIFHPTDFSPASDVAFVHALKLALASQGALTVFHFAGGDEADDEHDFPQVRQTLTQWGVLPPGSPREAVLESLGLRVRKVQVGGDDPADAMVAYLERHPADLIALATHQRSGAARWLSREVAVPLVRRAAIPALFVPPVTSGFVDPATGAGRLRRILMPIDRHPHPRATIAMVPALAAVIQPEPVAVELLHVGTAETAPRFEIPEGTTCSWTTRVVAGDAVDAILQAEQAWAPDLIVVTTEGRQGFLDALRGSTTEQIVRGARAPVLAVAER